MTDIVNGSQISFLLILNKALESSQNNSPDNELTLELITICPRWSVSHLVRKPFKRAATSGGHEHKGMKALPRLHLDIGLGQSHDYAFVPLGTSSDSSP